MCLNSNLLLYDSTVCSIFKPPPKMMDPRNKHQFLKAHLSAVIFSNVLISHVKFCLAESHIESQKPIMLNFLILTYETSVCILLDNFETVILLLHYIHCLIKKCDFKSISVYLSLLCMLLYFREWSKSLHTPEANLWNLWKSFPYTLAQLPSVRSELILKHSFLWRFSHLISQFMLIALVLFLLLW